MRKIYLVEIDKIDYAFLDNDLETIQFEIFQNYPIVKDRIIMDISTILKLRKTIDVMFELKKKKEELRNARNKK